MPILQQLTKKVIYKAISDIFLYFCLKFFRIAVVVHCTHDYQWRFLVKHVKNLADKF